MPEWVGWVFGASAAIYAAWLGTRLQARNETERKWEERLNAVERLAGSHETFFRENEKRRDEQHAENQRRANLTDSKLDKISDALGDLSNRLASTRPHP
jgi:hypothetical protein